MRVLFKSGYYFILVPKGCGYNSRVGIIRERVLITRVQYVVIKTSSSEKCGTCIIVHDFTFFFFIFSNKWRRGSAKLIFFFTMGLHTVPWFKAYSELCVNLHPVLKTILANQTLEKNFHPHHIFGVVKPLYGTVILFLNFFWHSSLC